MIFNKAQKLGKICIEQLSVKNARFWKIDISYTTFNEKHKVWFKDLFPWLNIWNNGVHLNFNENVRIWAKVCVPIFNEHVRSVIKILVLQLWMKIWYLE